MASSSKFSRNIRVFYTNQLLIGVANLWAPIIVIFQMQEIGLSLTRVLLGESIFAATIVLLEVPSGVFADRMGRKVTLVVSAVFWTLAITIFGLATGFGGVVLSQMLFGVAIALRSGADAALLFDSLKALKREREFTKVMSHFQTIGYLAAVPATIAGGLIAGWFGFRLAILLTAAITVLSLINFLRLSEAPSHEEGDRLDKSAFWHTWKALRYVWKHRVVRHTVVFAMIAGVGMKLSYQTLNPYWEFWNVPVEYFGIGAAIYNLVAALSSHHTHKVIRQFQHLGTLLLTLLLISGTFSAMAGVSVGIAGALLLPTFFQIARSLLPIATGDMVNRVTYSHHRATVLSMKSFLRQVSQIILLPLFGLLADSFGLLSAFRWTGLAIGLLGGLALYQLYVIPVDYRHGKAETSPRKQHNLP